MKHPTLHVRFLKQSISLLLAALLVLPVSVFPAFAAQEEGDDPSPIIYVIGQTPLYDDPSSPDRKQLAKGAKADILEAVKEALPYAAKAVLLGQWDDYADKAYDLLMEFYGGYGLNENGEVTDSSGPAFTWSESALSSNYRSNTPYTYHFEYDARLSPMEIADGLNEYIEAVKRVTGKDKVSIIGRCLGANVMLAYIQKYQEAQHYAGLDTAVFYDSSLLGIDVLEAAMSGNITVEPDTAGGFAAEYDLDLGNETLNEIVTLTLQMLRDTYGIEITAKLVERIYSHVRDTVARRFLMSTYASFPGYWSMVYEHFDEAKAYIFSGENDAQTYAMMIEKIDAFRNQVQLRYRELIAGMQANGVEVAAVCKYGFRGYPFYENAKRLSDGFTSLEKQSFGAACSEFDGTLEEDYIARREAAGFGAYISPDRQVDASVGLLPDTTWYLKNNTHNGFWDIINPLLLAICRNKDYTVHDSEQWTQYQYVTDPYHVVPMTEDNCDPNGDITHTGRGDSTKNPLKTIWNFFKYLFNLIKSLFGALKK